MATQITTRHHYVWREYLRAWSDNDKIWTIINIQDKEKKIVNTNLMNIAQERFFNKFNKFSLLEKKFLQSLCVDTNGPIKNLLDNILFDTNLFSDIKDIQEKISSSIPQPLDELENSGFDDLHTIIENDGKEIIACRSLSDLYFFEDSRSKYKALFFLCFQYFRTKKMKVEMINAVKEYSSELKIENIFSTLVIIFAAKITQNISFDRRICYTLLEISDNEISFITGDQPVINLAGNDKDEKGDTKDIIFYYPISPKHAIKIDFPNKGEKYNHHILEKKEVHLLNKNIYNEYNEFLFSNSKELLDAYI